MSLWICPICGKQVSIRHYDPSDFDDDILIIQLRGLGRGMGFEVVKEYSLLDGSDPELLNLISDRVAEIYDLLFEDEEDTEEEDDEEEAEDEDDTGPLSPLDVELLIAEEEDDEEEKEEEDEDENDEEEEGEYISDLALEVID